MSEDHYILTKERAQKYVAQLMEDVPYNINIIDRQGIIIASGDPDRIGSFHFSGKKAFDRKAKVLVHADQGGVRKGANEPVTIQGEIICVVGISGEPQEVQNYTKLLSSMIKLLIEQEVDTLQSMKQRQADEMFLQDLLKNTQGIYNEDIKKLARDRYHLDLTQSVTVILSKEGRLIKSLASVLKVTTFDYQKAKVIFVNTNVISRQQVEKLAEGNLWMDSGHNIAESLTNIKQSWAYFKLLQLDSDKPIFVKDYPFYLINPDSVKKNDVLIERIDQLDNELVATLAVFIKHNLDARATSEELFIHRNTVNYRLEKIHRQTQMNPRNIVELFILLVYLGNSMRLD
ncbi:sugar diacid recognition domain-containing protein [Aerococcaceae bacterium 50-4]